MAKCEYCGKEMSFGIKVSHSHRRSNRTWKPNVKKVKAKTELNYLEVTEYEKCNIYTKA